MGRKIKGGAAVLAFAALLMTPAGAQEQTDVLLAAVAGSRTLKVTTPAGANLSGGELNLGTAHQGAFVTTVTDLNYDHVGYQVSATLSNLYLFDGSFDCGKRVDSGDLSVAFPVDAQLQDLGALIEGLVDLDGTVSSTLASLLDPTGAIGTVLSTAGLDPLAGRALSAAGPVATQLEDTVAGVLDGADAALPVKISNGSAGPFSAASSHPACGEGSGTPTSRLVMSGDASSLGDFVQGLIADLEALVNGLSASGLIADGTIDAAAAEAAAAQAVQGLEDDINAELAALGLPPIALPQTGTVIDQVLDELIATLGLTDLIGQSGAGIAVPNLAAQPDSAPTAGIYKGRMVVTLVDVP